MRRILLPLSLLGGIACSAQPKPSKTVEATAPTPEPQTPTQELLAVLSGVVGSHDRVLAHELETRASRSPDLHLLASGVEFSAVDTDVVRFLPNCVAIDKSFDSSAQTFRYTADASGCSDQSGRVIAEQVVERNDEGLRLTEVHRLQFEDDRTAALTLSGEAERTRVVNRETLHSRKRVAELHVDVTVARETAADGVVDWPMTFDHEISLNPMPTGVQVAAGGTVQVEHEVRSFTLDGFWARDACGTGGWTAGTLTLEHDGQTHTLDLDCSHTTAEGLAGYAQPTIDAILTERRACEDCDLEGTNLQNTLYVGWNLQGVRLLNVDLTGAILFGSDLSDATVVQANLTAADFSMVDTDDGYFADCTFDGTRFVAALFDGTDLRYADLQTAVLDRADFEGASLHWGSLAGQDLSTVGFEDAWMTGVDFTGAILTGRDFEHSNFRQANFTNADLTGSAVHEASFTDAMWSNTTCADGSNSDENSGTCDGYW